MSRLRVRRQWLQAGLALGLASLEGPARADAQEDFERAVIQDNDRAMVNLVFRGVDPNTLDSRGRPGLVAALSRDSLRVFDVLLKSPGIRLDETSRQGESALMLAAIKGHLAIVRELIERGASVEKDGWTALHYAASAALPDSLAIVQLLVRKGAPVDDPSPNDTTPLMMAAQYSSEEVVAQLLKYGANPSAKNQRGWTALDFARQASRDYLVKSLTQAQQQQRRAVQPGRKPGW